MKPPAPPRVDRYLHWSKPPPKISARCWWWLDKITAGWRPGRRIRCLGYDCRAQFFGVYMWEQLNILDEALLAAETLDLIRKQHEQT